MLLSTDEATFTRDGVFNSHNTQLWCDENPHAIQERNFQDRFSVNVWAGIVGDQLIVLYLLPRWLIAHAYLEFLTNNLANVLGEIPLATRRDMWYLHNGAPAHYAGEGEIGLTKTFCGLPSSSRARSQRPQAYLFLICEIN